MSIYNICSDCFNIICNNYYFIKKIKISFANKIFLLYCILQLNGLIIQGLSICLKEIISLPKTQSCRDWFANFLTVANANLATLGLTDTDCL